MNSKNALTSAVMLETQWITRKKDILDLITPFVEYCVAMSTSLGEMVDISKVIAAMHSNFGYVDMPEIIIKRIFQRNTMFFQKKQRKYYLVKSLDSVVEKIETRRKECDLIIDSVGGALFQYLESHCQHEKVCSKEQALNLLHMFFAFYGIDISIDRLRIDAISRKTSEAFYYIARFIAEGQIHNTVEYKYILDLVKGYYLETVLYLQPDNGNLMSANYKAVVFYYDTPFLLRLLGYQSEQEKRKAESLHEMLKRQNASFRYFPQTRNEIINILTAYKYSINSNVLSNRTLDGLDAKHYIESDVDRLKNNFQVTLSRKYGIELTELPNYSQKSNGSVDERFVINEKDAELFVRNKVGHYRPESLEADIDSAIAIHKLRNGFEGNRIENCRHLFVTTNIEFVNAFNQYYRREIDSDNFDLTIDVGRLAAITWVKSNNIDADIPELQLLENAYSAQQPTPELIEKMSEVLSKMEAEGILSYEEAVSIRSDHFVRKELLLKSNGQVEKITEPFVEQIREEYEYRLVNQTREDTKSELYASFREKEEKTYKEICHNAERMAHEEAVKVKRKFIKRVNGIIIFISVVIFLVGIYGCVHSNSWGWNIPCGMFIALSCISIYDTVKSRRIWISKLIDKHANMKETEAFDLNYDKYITIYDMQRHLDSK